MLKPRALQPGDRIAIVAPASPFGRDEFDRGVEEIRRLGFVPSYDESVFARQNYLAGSAVTRAAAIRAAWQDPSIAAVIGVRGGYGSMQLLPLLDPAEATRARKPFVGYSDLTSILTFLTGQCGLVAFHGPMLAGRLSRGADGYDRRSFLGALSTKEPLGELTAPALDTICTGDISGPLYGGTVTQLLSSLGPATWPCAVSRRGRRAAIPAGPHGHATRSGWSACAGGCCGHRRAAEV
jgi:muramoyltetrapeptide carboxypeptidase